MEKSFEQQYREGNTPWDHGLVDSNLIRMVERFKIAPCRVLDIGCGTGDNAIWLAQHGFFVTGCDLSEAAIEMATSKPTAERPNFLVADFLSSPIQNGPFNFVFDRGCFHSIQGETARTHFAQKVASLLEPRGLWLSLIGNADAPRQENGPPQMTAKEVVAFIEPKFEMRSMEAGYFGTDQGNPPRAWICLMRRRP
jgi:2-polyprenyl-3-methyl-5-hydroxy-6-metoxy-1,4-benzoquinol methylase